MGTLDMAFDFQDKVLESGIGRKWAVGLSFTNKKRQFIAYVSGGIKGAKANLYSPVFRESFINDVRQNYVPLNTKNEDQVVAAKINQGPGGSLWGTYSQYLQAGFILNKKMKPSFSFCYGGEEFLLHDAGFRFYEDPKNGDIDYVGMSTTFFEIKIGCGFPFKHAEELPGALNLNIGYKWVDYGTMTFNKTPLSAYTNGDLAKKYHEAGKFLISVSLTLWSNWK